MNQIKKCQVCNLIERPGDEIRPHTLMNGQTIFTCRSCLEPDVVKEYFEEDGCEGIDLVLASKLLKDLLKRKKMRTEGNSAYFRVTKRRSNWKKKSYQTNKKK